MKNLNNVKVKDSWVYSIRKYLNNNIIDYVLIMMSAYYAYHCFKDSNYSGFVIMLIFAIGNVLMVSLCSKSIVRKTSLLIAKIDMLKSKIKA